jgi:hypothetical protein
LQATPDSLVAANRSILPKYLSVSFSATFTSPISIGISMSGPITAAKVS